MHIVVKAAQQTSELSLNSTVQMLRYSTILLTFISICFGIYSSACANPAQNTGTKKEHAMNPRPDCITKLSRATSFDDGIAGDDGKQRVNHAAYSEASAMIGGLESEDLQWLLANGSPAGRIYAAVLMKQSSRFGNDDSFGKLVSDKSPVTCFSGCKGAQTTVGDVCKQFISDGHYGNFKFSMFCKLMSPKNE